jgi:SAM-dependent methyltransferase
MTGPSEPAAEPAAEPAPEPVAESVAGNITQWTRNNLEYGDAAAEASWDREDITWGQFGIPDESVGSPLGDVRGKDVLELGCGVAYFSAWLAKRGARPVGLDPTPAQLATARRLQSKTGLRFPLIEAVAERVPLPDDSFDIVLSEYGASLWADPHHWVPEAARLLRSGGRLVFLTNSVLVYLCAPDVGAVTERLQRPQFGMYRVKWPEGDGTEYNLPHGDWIRLLRLHGFEVEELIEPQVPPTAETHEYYDFISAEWARQWPAEEIWVARLRG